jgi:hypothetical protein
VGEPEAFDDALWWYMQPAAQPAGQRQARALHDRRRHGVAGALRALAATGESLLVVCADARLRRRHLTGRVGGIDICSYDALEHSPHLADGYTHLAALDPPAGPHQELLINLGGANHHLHLLWGEQEERFALSILERDNDLRVPLRGLYRALRAAGILADAELARVLAQAAAVPSQAAALMRALVEVRLADLDQKALTIRLPPPTQADLAVSETFRESTRRLEQGRRSLGAQAARAA